MDKKSPHSRFPQAGSSELVELDVDLVQRRWRRALYSFITLTLSLAVCMWGFNTNLNDDYLKIAVVVMIASGICYLISVPMLARALKRSAAVWLLVVLIIPFGFGKIFAIIRFWLFVRAVRNRSYVIPKPLR